MKPISTNNMSAFGYVGLFILFCMPYVGTPALILFAIFGRGEARSFARALILLYIILVVLAVVVILLGFGADFEYYIEEGIKTYMNTVGCLI